MRLHLVLIGPPGCGKGTQAVRIAQKYGVPHVSTGDTLRAAVRQGTALGKLVESTLATGGLVDDNLMTTLVKERLVRPDTANGFILDGFPRTLAQARVLDEILNGTPPVVALISVADQAIVQRLGRRRVCASCAITQSVSGDEEGQTDPCPYCGGRLVRREDDHPETVSRRLATFAAFAEPVIAYYRSRPEFGSVDGLQTPDAVTTALSTLIESVGKRRG